MKKAKLVRDKIPEIIVSDGRTPITHIADDKEYYSFLKQKLVEEANEFLNDDSIEELVDVMEVIKAISQYNDFSEEEIEKVRLEKVEKRGSFNKKIILDDIE